MTAPGQMGMPSHQGMPGKQPGRESATSPGKQPGKNATMGKQDTQQKQTTVDQLAANPKLSGKLQEFFPAGTNLTTEATGFKNLGDFVAATHVSHNMGIPFGDLKGKIMSGKSLGQAIHELKPDADSKSEASRAQNQAKKTLHDSGL
ncbi:MAG: hypothetical protein HYX73_00515 [Acidobacteria bacterium]|nr:hypothetical protein [Acidobacteriota bacterium]